MLFSTQLKPALKLCWKEKKLIVLSSVVDIVFFAVLVLVHYEFFKRLQSHLMVLVAEMQKTSLDLLMQEDIQALNTQLMQSAKFVSAFHAMLKYVAVFFLALFITWVVLKNINWYIANRIVKKKVVFRSYAKFFALYSVFWFICMIAILLLTTYLMSYSTTTFLPLIGQKTVYFITLFLFAVLAYFAFISYSLIPTVKFKQVFKLAILKWKELVPAHIILILIAVFAVYIPFRLALIEHNVANWLALFFALLISIPALTYGRIYILLVVQNIIKKWIKKS